MFYRAPGRAVCADVIPFYDEGEFKLFYLRDYRNIEADGEGCPWCLLRTADLVNYRDCGEVLPRGQAEEQDLYVFTGSCIKANGEYIIFYTGHNPHLRKQGFPEQKILRAKSKDAVHWVKDKDFCFAAPDKFEMHDFRDPFVYFDEEKKVYGMLIAGRVKSDNPVDCKGVTLVAYSKDLDKWELADEPFYAPNAYFTHECPDLFKMGKWWYLVFSEFTDKIVTTYRMSESIDGPWITPKVNTFDGHAFYAAKSASDGKRRIMFGWNCIKNGETDGAPWQWGGTVIAHELVQDDDGTLWVRCPDEVRAAYSQNIKTEERLRIGGVIEKKGEYTLGDDGKNIVMFGKTPENFKLELKFRITDDRGDFGVILRENGNLDSNYAVKFEPKFNRFAFDRHPRIDNTVPFAAATERYCPLKTGEENTLLIIAEGSVLEVYVNDRVAMSERMFDLKEGNFGIYTHNTTVVFSDIKLCGATKK